MLLSYNIAIAVINWSVIYKPLSVIELFRGANTVDEHKQLSVTVTAVAINVSDNEVFSTLTKFVFSLFHL